MDIEHSAGVTAMRGVSGLEGQWGCAGSHGGSRLLSPLHSDLFAYPLPACRKPDIPVPYLYFDMGAAVLCASFMSFGVKRRWFALGAALQLAISTYAAYIGGYVHYGDWLKVSNRAPRRTRLGRWGALGVWRCYRLQERKDLRDHTHLPFRVWRLMGNRLTLSHTTVSVTGGGARI